jgi:hypothetical protein
MLRRFDVGQPPQDIFLGMGKRGTDRGCLPCYLTIVASPREIPWQVQYDLNGIAYVGRLDLAAAALERYVNSLLSDWQAALPNGWSRTAVWSPVHDDRDITRLMRDAIGERAHARFLADADTAPNARFIDGLKTRATGRDLGTLLAEHRPGIIVTTSHGMTAPLSDLRIMAARLGLPVDADFKPLTPAMLLRSWQPGGAIWYAHACCSAGGGGKSE